MIFHVFPVTNSFRSNLGSREVVRKEKQNDFQEAWKSNRILPREFKLRTLQTFADRPAEPAGSYPRVGNFLCFRYHAAWVTSAPSIYSMCFFSPHLLGKTTICHIVAINLGLISHAPCRGIIWTLIPCNLAPFWNVLKFHLLFVDVV